MTDDEHLRDLVTLGDLDELVREVGRRVASRDWDGLVRVRDACRGALDTGRQLWPVASLAEYRLALDAPGPYAASVLVEGAGAWALGPLPEVAAVHHHFAELDGHLDGGPRAGTFAHERVVRGEDLTAEPPAGAQVLELPLVLEAWEPRYRVATYHHDRVETDDPTPPAGSTIVNLPDAPPTDDGDEVVAALLDGVRHWAAASTGRIEAVMVEGTAQHAVAALGLTRAAWAAIEAGDAIARYAAASASGAAIGPRRGAAYGRFSAWWAACAIAGLDWPPDPDELGAVVRELRWHWWDEPAAVTGHRLRLAVEDPLDGLAWAISAVDLA